MPTYTLICLQLDLLYLLCTKVSLLNTENLWPHTALLKSQLSADQLLEGLKVYVNLSHLANAEALPLDRHCVEETKNNSATDKASLATFYSDFGSLLRTYTEGREIKRLHKVHMTCTSE
jgi:hypothetical protein